MNLAQINALWDEYKIKYNIEDSIQISAVQYDTEQYVEGCFNLLELLEDQYILHLNPQVHLYSESYVKFILFHEFTHFYDFIHCPFKEREDLFLYMNAYSEFHACRVTLAKSIERFTLSTVHMDKIQLPGPYNEISIRRLIEESLYRVKVCFDRFFTNYELNDFSMGFRQLMYLFGYLSLFKTDDDLVDQTLRILHLDDESFYSLYDALRKGHNEEIVTLYKEISDDAILIYIRASFRKYYDTTILPDDEIDNITADNYRDYIEKLDKKMQAKQAGLNLEFNIFL